MTTAHAKQNTLVGEDAEQLLRPGDYLESSNGRYQLRFQTDGNLVIYRIAPAKPERCIWASHTHEKTTDAVKMQRDGNLVMYHPGGRKSPWATGTNGKGCVKAVLENWGDLVLYDKEGRIMWSSINDIRSKWMSALEDDLTLKKICMPGSHDAGMYSTANVARGLALCQKGDLKQQLEVGARYFDLRPRYIEDDDLYIYHDLADGPKLATALESIKAFCESDSFKSEVIVLNFDKFKNFTGNKSGTDWPLRRFKKLITAALGPWLYRGSAESIHTEEPLGNLRGKIIVTSTEDKVVGDGIYRLGPRFDLLDKYSNKQDYREMVIDQAGKFKEFNDHRLFLLNWTLTPRGDTTADQVVSVAEEFIKYIPIWAAVRWATNRNTPLVGKVEAYALEVNPMLIKDLQANRELFTPNQHGQIVNIVNLDYIEMANVLPVCRFTAGSQ